MTIRVPLLDMLAYRMGCMYLSDLRFIPPGAQGRLAREVERIPSQDASLSEWNGALSYLTGEGPEPSAEQAKTRLAALLRESGAGIEKERGNPFWDFGRRGKRV